MLLRPGKQHGVRSVGVATQHDKDVKGRDTARGIIRDMAHTTTSHRKGVATQRKA
jgi:rare lipoprotein A (peptidoglycan hydrolase)